MDVLILVGLWVGAIIAVLSLVTRRMEKEDKQWKE